MSEITCEDDLVQYLRRPVHKSTSPLTDFFFHYRTPEQFSHLSSKTFRILPAGNNGTRTVPFSAPDKDTRSQSRNLNDAVEAAQARANPNSLEKDVITLDDDKSLPGISDQDRDSISEKTCLNRRPFIKQRHRSDTLKLLMFEENRQELEKDKEKNQEQEFRMSKALGDLANQLCEQEVGIGDARDNIMEQICQLDARYDETAEEWKAEEQELQHQIDDKHEKIAREEAAIESERQDLQTVNETLNNNCSGPKSGAASSTHPWTRA
ncbi:uncharacterized protein HMPREF1541_04347 [Cyphellophora europaea CBS 101466]|uniref:Uncharacterized protein n=1 Tax=Cyphellophora europaea (strain CBS 101466) TaxID=1220924 RepID=W2RUF2_CYPE1|nr:uncharacterized protein HMPREF1541_04347 [Cyphellophora europaea CBS 101466]ETN40072.1 hypothetical protein HMPREF1541_04347 [Cyphellophora europaea CBS 101466]